MSNTLGESGQTLRLRDIGHKSDIRTGKTRCGLYKHIRDFKDHDIDWENQIILDKDPDMFKRRIKEAVYIKANDDGYLMNPDKGCPINECWNEFGEEKYEETLIFQPTFTFPRDLPLPLRVIL